MSSKDSPITGIILNIQRYSLHDGSGIRTLVFFKGCPLRCPWCSNPESQSFKPEIARLPKKCIHCKECCMDVDECPSGAMTLFGKEMTVPELMQELLKDQVFYTTTGGGVTLSGGEVLCQSEFAYELLKHLKALGINTAIETSGQAKTSNLLKLVPYLDLILFDLKILDKKKAKEILHADIDLIKTNLETLVNLGKKVIPRIPVVPGYTNTKENIDAIIKLVKELSLEELHLLPLHHYGSYKYEVLNMDYKAKNIEPPSEDEMESLKEIFEKHGIKIKIGG